MCIYNVIKTVADALHERGGRALSEERLGHERTCGMFVRLCCFWSIQNAPTEISRFKYIQKRLLLHRVTHIIPTRVRFTLTAPSLLLTSAAAPQGGFVDAGANPLPLMLQPTQAHIPLKPCAWLQSRLPFAVAGYRNPWRR